ncbi:unnamed protein product [Spirodela intermedia]|uniref:Uncharacterized protein n=1 Tax=Spirodela intermedia TaxID=51605 RepID=A0A7I8IDK8_SPIIN|nr:unnamed protein product [Spirodela intermedia]CAA6655907.1 unnamed protein product [Spirodela intermedia]
MTNIILENRGLVAHSKEPPWQAGYLCGPHLNYGWFETVQIEQLHRRAGAVTRSDVSSGEHDNYVTVYEEREGRRLWWLLSACRIRRFGGGSDVYLDP